MSWIGRRTTASTDDSAGAFPFAPEFGGIVDRSFPIDDAAVRRMRAQVIGAFIEAAPSTPRRRLRRPMRRGLALGLTASISLLAFGVVTVQARPGGAFYPVRLAIENATLASAETPAGWQARLDRLDRRIEEALAAEAAGDPGAIAGALGEYRAEFAAMTAGSVAPDHRTALVAVVSRDVEVVLAIQTTYPSEAASLLINDLRAFLGPVAPDSHSPGNDRGIPADPHGGNVLNGDPHEDGATGDPHSDGTTGNPHSDGTTGNPHSDGTTGNPHSDSKPTGNPHSGGATGNPHATSKPKGNPHPSDKPTGNPHPSDKPTGNPHAGG